MTPLLQALNVALPGRLEPFELSSPGGELIALVGPNGSGKTSLLRALARVEEARGRVAIDGEDLDRTSEQRRRQLLSFLPATRDIVWPITVRDILQLGLSPPPAGQVDAVLDDFDLRSLSDRKIGQLSTGERSRVLLARAFLAGPRLLLLDEPLANLDPRWVLLLLERLAAAARLGATVIVALHDIALIDRFDRLLLMHGGSVVGDVRPAGSGEAVGALFGIEPGPDGRWRLPAA